MKDRQLQENQHTMEMKERELQQTQGQLQASEQLVVEFQQSLQQKDKTITDLQQTITSAHKTNIKHYTVQPQQQQVITPRTSVAATRRDISKMTWREGKNAPERMYRGAAVVHGNTAYFRPAGSKKVYSYQNMLGQEQWSRPSR